MKTLRQVIPYINQIPVNRKRWKARGGCVLTELSGERGLDLRDDGQRRRAEAVAEDGAQLLSDRVVLEERKRLDVVRCWGERLDVVRCCGEMCSHRVFQPQWRVDTLFGGLSCLRARVVKHSHAFYVNKWINKVLDDDFYGGPVFFLHHHTRWKLLRLISSRGIFCCSIAPYTLHPDILYMYICYHIFILSRHTRLRSIRSKLEWRPQKCRKFHNRMNRVR